MSIPTQSTKMVRLIDPDVIKDNASFTEVQLDTKGWEHCTIVAYIGDTDIAMAALKIQECATTGGSFVDVTGLVYGTSTGIGGSTSTLPSATDDNSFVAFDIDLKARHRFLEIVATAGDGSLGTYLAAFAILSRGHDLPVTAAERGCGQILRTT